MRSTLVVECTDESLLYSFYKCFPAVDLAAMGFRVVPTLAATDERDQGQHHVRITYGVSAKVMLLFMVPEAIVQQTAGNWQ